MDRTKFLRLTEKYGDCSSWAIWNPKDEADPTIIESHIEALNAKHVFVALNAWGDFVRNLPWANFRGGKHDRKLKYACNDTALRGSYLTDLFKRIEEVKAGKVQENLTLEDIKKHVSLFVEEMSEIGTTKETIYIILGVNCREMFKKHFLEKLGDVKVIPYYHYSYTLPDERWVMGIWEKLGITANYETIRQKYKNAVRVNNKKSSTRLVLSDFKKSG